VAISTKKQTNNQKQKQHLNYPSEIRPGTPHVRKINELLNSSRENFTRSSPQGDIENKKGNF